MHLRFLANSSPDWESVQSLYVLGDQGRSSFVLSAGCVKYRVWAVAGWCKKDDFTDSYCSSYWQFPFLLPEAYCQSTESPEAKPFELKADQKMEHTRGYIAISAGLKRKGFLLFPVVRISGRKAKLKEMESQSYGLTIADK